MSKYKVGDKVVMEITDEISVMEESWYVLLEATSIFETYLDKAAEPLSTYTEPLEAKIRRQATEITRLLAENKGLKDKLDNRCDMCIERHEKEVEQARAEGAETAWELARKITCQPINGGFNRSEFEKIFGYGYISDIFEKYKYTEAATKVVEWEKAKEEIKVGDIVSDGLGSIALVVRNAGSMLYLVFSDGSCGRHEPESWHKTGRHIDIDSFLKQIGEE